MDAHALINRHFPGPLGIQFLKSFLTLTFCTVQSVHIVDQNFFGRLGVLRLAGGNWNGEGRVEIFHKGSWGTVCDDFWDINDARVVCREIGYQNAVSAPQSAHFGSGDGQIWLDNVQCQGHESSILNCQHAGWGVENCDHDEDASVICSSKYNHNYICTAFYATVAVFLFCFFIPKVSSIQKCTTAEFKHEFAINRSILGQLLCALTQVAILT